MKLQLHCSLHRAPIQLFPSPQAFSHPYVHITSSLLFILYCSDFKTVLSPFESLPLEPFIQSRTWSANISLFSQSSRHRASRDASRCRPDLARRPRDVARIRERRQASRRRRKRGVRGFMFPLGIPFSCLTAFRFTSTSRRCT